MTAELFRARAMPDTEASTLPPIAWEDPAPDPQPIAELSDAQLLAFARATINHAISARFKGVTGANVAAGLREAGFALTTEQVTQILFLLSDFGLITQPRQKSRPWVIHPALRDPDYAPPRTAALIDHLETVALYQHANRKETLNGSTHPA